MTEDTRRRREQLRRPRRPHLDPIPGLALPAGDDEAAAPSLRARFELIIAEGAGSPAEINLRTGDIANMGFAEAADVPVLIVGDIERGGVIAQLVGTCALLSLSERARLAGYIVNNGADAPSPTGHKRGRFPLSRNAGEGKNRRRAPDPLSHRGRGWRSAKRTAG